jgi:hypothetical protein
MTIASFAQPFSFSDGDIMVIAFDTEGYFSSDPNIHDEFGNGIYLVNLVDIPAGESFFVTDNKYSNSSSLFSSDGTDNLDGTVKWTNGSSVLPAGSVISIYFVQANNGNNIKCSPGSLARVYETDDNTDGTVPNGKMNLDTRGDAIYVYTEGSNGPEFITAFTNEGFNSDNGDLPTGLSSNFNIGNREHCGVYNGSLSGFATIQDLKDAIYDSANWAVEKGPGNNSLNGVYPDIDLDVADVFDLTSLPIELLSFDVKKFNEDQAVIQWTSASELNNDYYEVERAGADLRFEAIESVEGAIQSDVLINYEVMDEQPLAGLNYYRLKQVDLDGTTTYFDIRSLDFGSGQQGLVYPNPVNDKIFIDGESYLGASYTVVDLSGAVKLSGVVTKSLVELSAESLKEGIYFLQLISQGETHTFKFSKN